MKIGSDVLGKRVVNERPLKKKTGFRLFYTMDNETNEDFYVLAKNAKTARKLIKKDIEENGEYGGDEGITIPRKLDEVKQGTADYYHYIGQFKLKPKIVESVE